MDGGLLEGDIVVVLVGEGEEGLRWEFGRESGAFGMRSSIFAIDFSPSSPIINPSSPPSSASPALPASPASPASPALSSPLRHYVYEESFVALHFLGLISYISMQVTHQTLQPGHHTRKDHIPLL